jgi:2,4-dienoyl-CoA reductase-like NADH-dependent reductase (Old Yellow Enzyme family)|nr:alkene reductase [Candidatus Krumholzibacteria bacterium]
MLLFKPLTMGAVTLPNRVIMAPLTRCRAIDNRVPNALMVEYYRQRAGAGFILSEATAVDPMGVGYPSTPGIWTEEQTTAWRPITDAVHQAGGLIFMQLWHVGRVSDPVYLDGRSPVAPSAVAQPGHVSLVKPQRPYPVPRALEIDEIPDIIAAYRQGAENAKVAGFDGVEVHGANGYLPDQFLQASSNQRTDEYGGSLENRARFLLEVTDAVVDVWGADRVGMHLAPRGGEDPKDDPTGEKIFSHVARELGRRKLAFICGREPQGPDWLAPQLKKAFGGVYIANQEFTAETAEAVIAQGLVDAVAFGRSYIANPDLEARFQQGHALNTPDPATFYGDGPEGYTDYPTMEG